MRWLCVTAALLLFMAGLPATSMAQQTGSDEDPLVAKVNDQEVRRSEVLEAAKNLPAQYQAQLEQIFPTLVERVVDFRLLAAAPQAARQAEDEEGARRMGKLRLEVMREVYLERRMEERVNPAALQSRFDAFLVANPPAEEVWARHILLEDEDTAKAAIVTLEGGADFAELARERSTGPSSAQGGDLGYFTAEQMVPEFSQAAFAMEIGSHSKAPVKTQFGWHVIKVEDRRKSDPPAFEEMEGQLRQELQREAVTTILGELRQGATIEILPTPPLPPQGGVQ